MYFYFIVYLNRKKQYKQTLQYKSLLYLESLLRIFMLSNMWLAVLAI